MSIVMITTMHNDYEADIHCISCNML